MATGHQTQDSQPPRKKYALPDGSFPTPNINDLVIVEDFNLTEKQAVALVYGTPHPKVTTAKLVDQKELEQAANGMLRVRRTYVTERAAQDAYNYQIQYSGENSVHPVFVRTYLERRDSYAPATKLAALGKVYKLVLTAGGTGYTSAPTVTVTGGAGSGFAATAQVQAGAVVALLITNCGTGYTSAPTIGFTGGGGSGATATATIQLTTTLLVAEEASPAPGELGTLFLQVVRVYETLPGPSIVRYGTEPETGLTLKVVRQRLIGSTAALTALGSPSGDFVVLDDVLEPVNTCVITRITTLIDDTIDGFTRTEYKSVAFQFPAKFTLLTQPDANPPTVAQWAIPNPPFTMQGPFPGVDYELTAHRAASKPAEVVYTYNAGPSGAVPNTWTVTSPGNASRVFRIGGNTVHGVIKIYEWQGAVAQLVENLPASTPSSYTAGTTEPVIQASEELWKGNIYRMVVVTVTE